MNIAKIKTKLQFNSQIHKIDIEVSISHGLPMFNIVGLPEKSVRESKDRVRSALLHTQFNFPNKRITINLTPGDLHKYGTHYDLPIALGILLATGQIQPSKTILDRYYFFGELNLSGGIRTPKGLLSCLLDNGDSKDVCVFSNHEDSYNQLIPITNKLVCNHLTDLVAFFNDQPFLNLSKPCQLSNTSTLNYSNDITDVHDQFLAKKALTLAAAGCHHLLMFGSPGIGKSMLAERLITLLPPLDYQKGIEVMCLYDQAGIPRRINDFFIPPFRSPHHIISPIALVGGGMPIAPGEISLSHEGVLFLDELGEFQKNALEALREPLEKGIIHIKRAKDSKVFQSRFQLIAAMNPRDDEKPSISKAILDRIDITIKLAPLKQEKILNYNPHANNQANSATLRHQVEEARKRQYERQNGLNGTLPFEQLKPYICISESAKKILGIAINRLDLSVRASHKIMRLARTAADLDKKDEIEDTHIAQCLQMRSSTHL